MSHPFQYFDKLFKYEHHFPLQCSCLENSMDRGAWRATVREVAELDMTEYTWTRQKKACHAGLPCGVPSPPLSLGHRKAEWVQHCLSVNADFAIGVPWLSLFSLNCQAEVKPAFPASPFLGIILSPGHLPIAPPCQTFC